MCSSPVSIADSLYLSTPYHVALAESWSFFGRPTFAHRPPPPPPFPRARPVLRGCPGPFSSLPLQGKRPAGASWFEGTTCIGRFNTVEGFWQLYA